MAASAASKDSSVVHPALWLRFIHFCPLIDIKETPLETDISIHEWMEEVYCNPSNHQEFDFDPDRVLLGNMGHDRMVKVYLYLRYWHQVFIQRDVEPSIMQFNWFKLMEFLPPSSAEKLNRGRARSKESQRQLLKEKLPMDVEDFDVTSTWPPCHIFNLRKICIGFWQLFALAIPLYRDWDSSIYLNPREARPAGPEFLEYKKAKKHGLMNPATMPPP